MSGRQHEGNGQREKEERAKKSTYKNEVGSEQGEKRGRAIETRIIQNKLHPTGQQDRCWLQDRTHQYINERKMPCWSIATMGATKTAMSKSISFPLFHISMSCLAQQCSRALHIESSQASKLRGVGFCFFIIIRFLCRQQKHWMICFSMQMYFPGARLASWGSDREFMVFNFVWATTRAILQSDSV